MFKKRKKLLDERGIPKAPRRPLPWLLSIVTSLMLQEPTKITVLAQSCSNLKFPLTLGFNTGETEITSID